MRYLKISNDGLLDPRLIPLMGGTTKTNKPDTIGEFGTGLKYGLAWLMRNGIDFKIVVDGRLVDTHTMVEEISGEEFEILWIDDVRTSITSKLGKDWTAWMILREVWCNAMDEGGEQREVVNMKPLDWAEQFPKDGRTYVYLQLAGDILFAYDNWDKYFATDRVAVCETDKGKVYQSADCLRIYKQGVLIHEAKEVKSIFDYDIPDATINELREYQYWGFDRDAYNILSKLDAKGADYLLTQMALRSDKGFKEENLDLSWHGPEDKWKAFVQIVDNRKIISRKDFKWLQKRNPEVSEDDYVILPTNFFAALADVCPYLSAVKKVSNRASFQEVHDPAVQLKVESAIETLNACGFDVPEDIKWITGEFIGGEYLATANTSDRIVMVSNQFADKGMKDVVDMIVEEVAHITTGFSDCTRPFQNYFIQKFTSEMLKANSITF